MSSISTPQTLRTPFESRLHLTWLMSAVSLAIASVVPVAAAEHTSDSLAVVQRSLASGEAVLLDVRERREWDAGHLRDARLAPLSTLPQALRDGSLSETVPRDKVIYCHCAAGGRVLKAADLLQAAGYDVRPLKLGYNDLLRAGFPAAKGN